MLGVRMYEILDHLAPGVRVLDLGCKTGSFPAARHPGFTVRLDLARRKPADESAASIQADAACLPFRSRSFDVVIANHSLEHVASLKPSLQEIGRVLKADGALYVAVPDRWTWSDRIYRWVFGGGGHLNDFGSQKSFAEQLAWYTRIELAATRTLCSSWSFLNRRNADGRLPRRALIFGFGTEPFLTLFSLVCRWADRCFSRRLSVYGWCFYLGHVPEKVDSRPWTNVCVRCGAGHPSEWLETSGIVRRRFALRNWRCPGCGADNFFTRDEDYRSLK